MLALRIQQSDIKQFMNKLLKGDEFYVFDARDVVVQSFARFEITTLPPEPSVDDSNAEKPAHQPWKTLQPYVFHIIRGGQKPKNVKAIFSLNKKDMEARFPQASALFLNIIFDADSVVLTTGVAEKQFNLQRTLWHEWDDYVKEFLQKSDIQAE